MDNINIQDIKPGMYVKVFQKTKEGDKAKSQQIEGLVLSRKHGNEPGATITLRKIIDGVAVEWILPIFSPLIQRVELIKSSRVRRSKLYYLRNKSSKQVRKKLKTAAKKKDLTALLGSEDKEETKEEAPEEK
ncbi:MAG: 50S ribosomal protein L19 [Minisyncoccia bacterium]